MKRLKYYVRSFLQITYPYDKKKEAGGKRGRRGNIIGRISRTTGVYIVQFDHSPPPPLLRSIFSPADIAAAGGTKAGVLPQRKERI